MRIPLVTFSAMIALGLAGMAEAHAFLEHADPRVGAVVTKPPATVRLTFTESVEAVFCRVTVLGPPGLGGAEAARPAPGDPRGLTVELRAPIPPGAYTVHWRVLSVDTHISEGTFGFRVRA